MSAATQLLDALVQLVTVDPLADPPDERFSLAFAPERSWHSEADLSDTTTKAVFTWDGFRPLGRAGRLRLEQHLVGLILQSRPENVLANSDVDPLAQLREELVDVLQDWSDDQEGFRVVAVLNPTPYDRAKLTSPGLWQTRLLLDCEVLRTVGDPPEEIEPDPDALLPLLTKARQAFWTAIENWPAFDGYWSRKYTSDDDIAELMLRDPAPDELPALAMTWGGVKPATLVHRMQQWPIAITATAWLPANEEAVAQQRVQDLIEAVYQSTAAGKAIPAVKDALRQWPQQIADVAITPTQLGRDGQLAAVRVDVQFVLRALHDPFGNLS